MLYHPRHEDTRQQVKSLKASVFPLLARRVSCTSDIRKLWFYKSMYNKLYNKRQHDTFGLSILLITFQGQSQAGENLSVTMGRYSSVTHLQRMHRNRKRSKAIGEHKKLPTPFRLPALGPSRCRAAGRQGGTHGGSPGASGKRGCHAQEGQPPRPGWMEGHPRATP